MGRIIDLIEAKISRFIERIRPPIELRDQLDLSYKYDGKAYELFEIRPSFMNPELKIESSFAKIRYYKTKNIWKLYWKRANGKWLAYEPKSESKDISDLLEMIDEDAYGCFNG